MTLPLPKEQWEKLNKSEQGEAYIRFVDNYWKMIGSIKKPAEIIKGDFKI